MSVGRASGESAPADGPSGGPSGGAGHPGRPGPAARAGRAARSGSWAEGWRFAVGTLSVLPTRVTHWDRPTAARAMLLAPLVGVPLGVCAAAPAALVHAAGGGAPLAGVVAVAALAALTRGLHLDGLADTADGLGSGKPAEDALRIMKASDIGPFGVLVLLLVLMGQVAAVGRAFDAGTGRGAVAVLVAAVAARSALSRGCRVDVPSARPGGLGAMVAGTLSRPAVVGATALGLLGCAGLGLAEAALTGREVWGATGAVAPPLAALQAAGAAAVGLVAARALLGRCVRRLGGVTGDVLGAMAETSAAAALLVLALG
ncbi:adenosylcobinamide-GDP ribazoletransferase [Allostreptomyces psammosilenae]|uniref:Adenosylcobinamide-GDP ribazoletransferase n=1 Tax=Allostreptomyces psammosilenae TaxID=1892865 RepID=A0A853A900_9ACTN|nr:adenosylcobinamide-GDP ribazoletransferase [Allostreptomyces psammosilenae]NYI06998.1 adenosylcobinamide-GDP ribazoletransferase [Allostreptomyces psammosilenae]